jgi:hypothetical protein
LYILCIALSPSFLPTYQPYLSFFQDTQPLSDPESQTNDKVENKNFIELPHKVHRCTNLADELQLPHQPKKPKLSSETCTKKEN